MIPEEVGFILAETQRTTVRPITARKLARAILLSAYPGEERIRIVMMMANWSIEEFARRVDVSERTVRRWLKGDGEIPYAAWRALCAQAGFDATKDT